MIKQNAKIYVAGHRGMVGSAIVKQLTAAGHTHIITRTHAELDLLDQQAVKDFMQQEKPDYVVLAAAKVGGIHANNTYPAEFIYQNLMLEANVIHQAWAAGCQNLLFLGSSCIYPKSVPQPMLSHLNVGTGVDVTIKELAETIQAVVGFTGDIIWDSTKPDGTPRKLMAISKVKALGWEPKVNLKDGLIDTYRWFIDHQNEFKAQ